MRKTLQDLSRQILSISGTDRFTPDLQDRFAYKLLVRRGHAEFIVGKISLVQFTENLAKEWASLPVLAAAVSARLGAASPTMPGTGSTGRW